MNRAGIPREWADRMIRHLQRKTKDEILAIQQATGPSICVGMFAMVEPMMGLRLYRVALRYRDDGGNSFSVVAVPDEPGLSKMPQVVGFGDGFEKIWSTNTDRARRFRAELEANRSKPGFQVFSVVGVVQKTIEWFPGSTHVGGQVDAVRLSRDGSIEWIQRKPNCAEQ